MVNRIPFQNAPSLLESVLVVEKCKTRRIIRGTGLVRRAQWPALSKKWVCGCSLAEIAGSNPAGGMYISFECCMLSGRGLASG